MAKQYVPCPACGALGEIGSNCQFCNTTILQKEGVIASDTRLVEKRTITPRQYAEKISIYHEVYSLSETYSEVEIGDQKGIINLNGDLIFPLERRYGSFSGISSSIVALEGDKTIQYYNLNSFEKIVTNKNGFIEDKNDPKKLHYLDPKNWTIKNEYINHKGETKTYDYAEILDLSHLSHKLSNCKFYIFHQENSLSLCLIEEIFTTDNTIEYLQKKYLNKYIIFLEGIKAIGKLEEIDEDLFLPIEIQDEEKFKLEIATLHVNEYSLNSLIWDEWLDETNPLKIKKRKEEFLDDIEVDQNLFAQIQEYVQEVQANSNIKKALWIDFVDNLSIYIDNAKTSEAYNHKPSDNKKTGIQLNAFGGSFNQKEWKKFINSELFPLCEIGVCGETEEGKVLYLDDYIEEANASSISELLNNEDYQDCFVPYLNFSFNATPLCKTIQYLAKLFNCPLDKIKITVDPNNGTTNRNSSNSDSNGCFGMLALMISIGGAGIYGLIELANKLIV